jgi:hypothetical protein
LNQNCKASFNYYEPVAFEAVKHALNTRGLIVIEKKKLKLGPYVLDSKLLIDEFTHVHASKASTSDIEELMEFRGNYGSAESLTLKGLQKIHSSHKD